MDFEVVTRWMRERIWEKFIVGEDKAEQEKIRESGAAPWTYSRSNALVR